MRRIKRRAHTRSDDVKAQVDTAWAVGMRAGIDEGRQQAAIEVNNREIRIAELENEIKNHKITNQALRRQNGSIKKNLTELGQRMKNAWDYIRRLERHLDPSAIQTTLLVRADGTPFNEETHPKKGNHKHPSFNVAGTETGRFASAWTIDFNEVRPRGERFSRQTPESVAEHANRVTELAAAYGASPETQRRIAERADAATGDLAASGGIIDPEQAEAFVQHLIDNPTIIRADEAEGPDQSAIATFEGDNGLIRVDSLTSLQEVAGQALAQQLDDEIMSEYGQDESTPEGAIRFSEPDEPGVVRDDQGEVVAVYDPEQQVQVSCEDIEDESDPAIERAVRDLEDLADEEEGYDW